MVKILLLSDTHGYLDPRVHKYLGECDQVWHAGDMGSLEVCDELAKIKPLVAVHGNIDGQTIQRAYPKHQRFQCEGVEVWMTHIGGYPGRYAREVREELRKRAPKLFICGHSHILKVIYDERFHMLCMNPGAVGNYGIHQVKTMLRFAIEGSEIRDLAVIELGNK